MNEPNGPSFLGALKFSAPESAKGKAMDSERQDRKPVRGDGEQARPTREQLVLLDDSNLQRLRARPQISTYLSELWARRHFIWTQARAGALSSGRGTFLGSLWILLTPILQVAVYAFIFGFILNTSRGIDNFIGFLILGVIFFRILIGGISAGSGLVSSSRKLITSFQFPRAALAISTNLKRFIDNIIPAIMAIFGCIIFQLDKPVYWTIVLTIPIYLLIHIFGIGTTLIIARITAFLPDAKSIVIVFNRGLFFLSGVFFSIERFATQPVVQEIMTANPIYQFLRAVRNCVMLGVVPSWQEWVYLSAWSFGLLLVGFVFFWQAEERYSSVR